MDPYLANQFASPEAKAEEATALVEVRPNSGAVARPWTKHPAFWFGVAAITGVGLISIAMRYSGGSKTTSKKKLARSKKQDREVRPSTESLFEALEDDGGIDDDFEEETEEEEVEEFNEAPEFDEAPVKRGRIVPEKKPRKKRSDAGKPRKKPAEVKTAAKSEPKPKPRKRAKAKEASRGQNV